MLGLGSIAAKIFGTSNDRKVKKYRPAVVQINALEGELAALEDDALRDKTTAFRARARGWRAARRSASGGLRHGARGRQAAPWASAISTSSWSAAWCCTKAASPK